MEKFETLKRDAMINIYQCEQSRWEHEKKIDWKVLGSKKRMLNGMNGKKVSRGSVCVGSIGDLLRETTEMSETVNSPEKWRK